MKTAKLELRQKNKVQSFVSKWKGSALLQESTLHQLSPYIGKIKSSFAKTLISEFTSKNQIIYDPYSGSGTIALESWAAHRSVIANDLSPYAALLTKAKLFPYISLEEGFNEIDAAAKRVQPRISDVDLRKIPKWVRSFFHPETLRETLAWANALKSRKSYFLLSCLLGILHHQRPGFLSYPSSHTVPYLREKNFPRDLYPELYEYRSVQERLQKKVERALKRTPNLDFSLSRECHMRDAIRFKPSQKVGAIITSPPYMRQLDYGRDNRLRLWFLGTPDWRSLDNQISPSEAEFFKQISSCLNLWRRILLPKGKCILVLGDIRSKLYNMTLADAVTQIAVKDISGYSLLLKYTDTIPNERRVRRGYCGSMTETILVLRKKGD
jgi:DNA modification methylase